MRKKTFILFTGLIIFFHIPCIQGQETDSLYSELHQLADSVPELNHRVDISVTDVSIQEFLRAVANNAGVNINVDPSLKMKVVNNFQNVKVIDILLFLKQQYNLKIEPIGNIINVKAKKTPEPIQTGSMEIDYNPAEDLFSINCSNKPLNDVAREITEQTSKNIILEPGLSDLKVQGFIRDKTFAAAMDKFAYTNGLESEETRDGFFLLKKKQTDESAQKTGFSQSIRPGNTQQKQVPPEMELNVYGRDSINLYAVNTPVVDIIKHVSNKLGVNYFVTSEMETKVSLSVRGVSYEDLLLNLLNGTKYTYNVYEDIYLIGEKRIEELRTHKVVHLQHRTIDTVRSILPESLAEQVEVKEFIELNSLFVSGPPDKVEKVAQFIRKIDKSVPVILIEVMIIDFNKSHIVKTGVSAGLSEGGVETSGDVYPGVDFTLSSEGINDLIERFNGFGWVKIGKVTPDFYMTLQAMEDEGILNVRSTPKLSTINGRKATMSIGNKEYYLEKESNLMGTQNPQLATRERYRSVEAELKVDIRPVISGDNQVTMNINVNQSDFTERINENAPPGQVTRSFQSTIRIKNQEMVLLGGLEEKRVNSSGKGLPLLSRIPVLKWIFSSRNDQRSKGKLNIFIKPTIIN